MLTDATGRRKKKRTAFVSGQEQQIFLPELPTLGAAAAASAMGAATCCEGFGGSAFDPDDPIAPVSVVGVYVVGCEFVGEQSPGVARRSRGYICGADTCGGRGVDMGITEPLAL